MQLRVEDPETKGHDLQEAWRWLLIRGVELTEVEEYLMYAGLDALPSGDGVVQRAVCRELCISENGTGAILVESVDFDPHARTWAPLRHIHGVH